MLESRDNLYELYFPFENLGDQLDNEIVPLRVQWAQSAGQDALDPNSDSWKRFKELYSYQFQEEKTVALFAPELSFSGNDSSYADQYHYGRYLRIVYLYVKPEKVPQFEDFVHKFIVPAATQILAMRDEVVHAPPVGQRRLYKLPTHMRRVSINVNMPTIPEFELFMQKFLVPAAKQTNTPLLTYRTVTGNKHNYHILYPVSDPHGVHYNNKTMHFDDTNLMASSLLRKHQLQTVALRGNAPQDGPRLVDASYSIGGGNPAAEEEAVVYATELAEQFHSHAIHIEEVVNRTRPDMGSALSACFTSQSIDEVNSAHAKSK